ncbi:methylesterase 18-like isoform X2 [Humulus lupulus]|uniref:methylesterase 18-like isoform X2 n=1 Tax=Humulus lupulus TaxID=3486 RepID=UPI002B404ADA|nr:methylesterase 18-like isoform X2 [Humulus lupulus]
MASEESGSKQLHFVLVHGAGHGGWCWYKIRILLEDAGYKVTCIDLKCSGIDPTDYNTIFTFADYNEPLTTFISNLPSDEKIILVGHSAGGRNVTDALNQFPQKIHMVIYVTAMMVNLPFNFKTTASQHNLGDELESIKGTIEDVFFPTSTKEPQLLRLDLHNVNPTELVRAIPGENFSYDFIKGIKGLPFPTGITVKPELQNQVLYNLSPIEDYTMASMLLRPTPVWSLLDLNFAEAVEGADNVPRVYIKTLKDELCNPMMQQLMIKMWPPTHVFTIESDHSPFFSKPDQLFSHFVEAVSSIKIK